MVVSSFLCSSRRRGRGLDLGVCFIVALEIFKTKTSDLSYFAFPFAGFVGLADAAASFRPVAHELATSLYGPHGGYATFQQLIDHSNPGLGTFSQQYWWNTTFWNGPVSPVCFAGLCHSWLYTILTGVKVILLTPGEEDASQYTGYMTGLTMVGQYAQEIGGATIVLERMSTIFRQHSAQTGTEHRQQIGFGASQPLTEYTIPRRCST